MLHLQSAPAVVNLRALKVFPDSINNFWITHGPTSSLLVINGIGKFGEEGFKTHLVLTSIK